METIQMKFKYTKDEYVKASRQYLCATKTVTKLSLVLLPLCVLFFLCAVIVFFNIFSAVILGCGLIVCFIEYMLYFFMPARKFRQTTKFHDEYHLIFSQDGISFTTPTIQSELKWDVYSGLWESGEFYFLVQVSRGYTVIPKRAFSCPEAQQCFEKIAMSNIKGVIRKL